MPEFTTEASHMLQLANIEAQKMNHAYIGTEHLLLAMLKPNAGTWAGEILARWGIDYEKARGLVSKYVPPGNPGATFGKMPHTPRTEFTLNVARKECQRMGDSEVGTVHILIALVKDHTGVAGLVLDSLGFDLAKINESLEQFRHLEKKEPAETVETSETSETVHYGELELKLPNDRKLYILYPKDINQKELCYLERMIEWTQTKPQPL